MKQFDRIKQFVMNLTEEITEEELVNQIIVSLSIPRKVVENSIAELITAKMLMIQQDGKLILNPELLKAQEEIKHVEFNVKLIVEHFLKNGINSKDKIISEMYDEINGYRQQLEEITKQTSWNNAAAEQQLKLVDENNSLKNYIEELKKRIESKENKELLELKEQYEQQLAEKDNRLKQLEDEKITKQTNPAYRSSFAF